MSEKKIKRSNVIQLWGNIYPEVKRWLGRLQLKKTNAWYLWQFCKWAKKTPTELLALKTNLADTRAEQLLDDFAIAETPQFTNPIKFNIIIAVKSLFKHNYRDLAKASEKFPLGANHIKKPELHSPSTKISFWNTQPFFSTIIYFSL